MHIFSTTGLSKGSMAAAQVPAGVHSLVLAIIYSLRSSGGGTVTCYLATGESAWQNSTLASFDDAMGIGPRATPVFDQGLLYTLGTGVLQRRCSNGKDPVETDLVRQESGIPAFSFSVPLSQWACRRIYYRQ